jgi:hypothetical protein
LRGIHKGCAECGPSTAAVKAVDILPDDDEYKNEEDEEEKDEEDEDEDDEDDEDGRMTRMTRTKRMRRMRDLFCMTRANQNNDIITQISEHLPDSESIDHALGASLVHKEHNQRSLWPTHASYLICEKVRCSRIID